MLRCGALNFMHMFPSVEVPCLAGALFKLGLQAQLLWPNSTWFNWKNCAGDFAYIDPKIYNSQIFCLFFYVEYLECEFKTCQQLNTRLTTMLFSRFDNLTDREGSSFNILWFLTFIFRLLPWRHVIVHTNNLFFRKLILTRWNICYPHYGLLYAYLIVILFMLLYFKGWWFWSWSSSSH